MYLNLLFYIYIYIYIYIVKIGVWSKDENGTKFLDILVVFIHLWRVD
jgi:hypothetical protein